MKRNRPDTPLFSKSEVSEMERLASQNHPQLIPHARTRLLQYRQHYEADHSRIAGIVAGSGRRFSRMLIIGGSLTSAAAATMELTGAESPNGQGPLVVIGGLGVAAVGLAWRRAIPNEEQLPASQQLTAIDGYLAQLPAQELAEGESA